MRWLAALALICGVVLGACSDEHDEHEVSCYEDQSCWDCETMGNRTCGPLP